MAGAWDAVLGRDPVAPGMPKEKFNGVGKAGARSGRCAGRAGCARGLSGGDGAAGTGGGRGITIASGGCVGAGAAGERWASGRAGVAGRAAVDVGAGGGGGGGGGSDASDGGVGGTGGVGATAGAVSPGIRTPGMGEPDGFGSSGFGLAPVSFTGERPWNIIAKFAGASCSGVVGGRLMVISRKIRMPRCSASDAVSVGPSRRVRPVGRAMGDRPGDPAGNRTNLSACPTSPWILGESCIEAFYIDRPASASRGVCVKR